MRKSILFIVSAPSGAGKTSLLKALIPEDGLLALSVSHTTRERRSGEVTGVHYHFIPEEAFRKLVRDGAFLEHAQVFDNFYGTSEAGVRQQLASGHDVVLEIDWQGARQVRKLFPDAVSIFIAPPSIAALRERLAERGQDSAEVVERRMKDASKEMSHYPEYDYLVINDNFDIAELELHAVIRAERMRTIHQTEAHQAELSSMLGG